MPFSPWLQHDIDHLKCVRCGIVVPEGAANEANIAYSHHYTDGTPVFSPNPHGRTEPCRTNTEKPH